jgi:hypothetical protein
MRSRLLLVAFLLGGLSVGWAAGGAFASGSVQECQRGCNKRCKGAKNKAKCVGECRRACR